MTGFTPENFLHADIRHDGVIIHYVGDLGYTSALISRRTLEYDNSEDFTLLLSFALLVKADLFRD